MSEKKITDDKLKDVPVAVWKKLSQKKIYFGHQSVGYDIIDGIKDLVKLYPQIKLNIVETIDKTDFKAGLFAHSKVGQNRDPKSKNAGFQKVMESGIGNRADIAFYKYCYVDVTAKTDVSNLFEDYTNTMTFLQKKYPDTNFIHVTVPLMSSRPPSVKARIKALIKMILGRHSEGPEDNIKRNEFNEMLRKSHGETGYIFDLATAQSTYSDRTRSTFRINGKSFFAMAPEYTYDGGHLNETGRKVVAEQFLLFIANLAAD